MCRQHEHNIYKVNFDYDFILLPEANYFHCKSYCGTIQTKDITAAYKGLASMLADVHILIFVVLSTTVRAEVSLFNFCAYLHLWFSIGLTLWVERI